jgi:hypothetical protein
MTSISLTTADVVGLGIELAEHGYAVIPGVVDRDRLATLRDAVDGAWANAPKFKGGGMLTGHLNCYPGEASRFVLDELDRAGITDAVHTIRVGKPNRIRATMNYNLPGSVAQHYHVDGAFQDDFLVANIAVVDTDLVNGAIDVLPGSHHEFMPFWQYALRRTYKRSTRLQMSAGDVLLRRSNLWHRGMPNMSDRARPLMSITFGEASAPEGDPFAVNGGKVEFYANWYRTNFVGQARERVYKAAPITYSAYRFVRSIGSQKGNAA